MGQKTRSQRSVMQHNFSQVPAVTVPRSSFNRSHGYKTTFDADFLYPIFVDEALPGDTFNLSMTALARLATPLKPIMDNMFIDTFFFFVPYRLVWDNWEKFNGAQDAPGDSTEYVIPQFLNTGGVPANSVHAYMGVPPLVTDVGFSALPSRAYNLIYNEWFRDQNLQEPAVLDTSDTTGNPGDYAILRRRGKRHDYFTSALPWPQKGDPVTLSLGGLAPVEGIGTTSRLYQGGGSLEVSDTALGTGEGIYPFYQNENDLVIRSLEGGVTDGDPDIYADLSEATAITINQLREGFQIQRMFERDARGGTRYTEIIKSHFGVTSPDARLQRPEYLGGGSSPVNITPIANTAGVTGATTVLADLAAIGTTIINKHGFTKSFTEHGIVIGLINVRADLTYQQGLNKMWSRETRFDFYWPSLSHLGEQAILNKEIYADGSPSDEDVFGYQERYAEYRYKPSLITGKFLSSDPESLDLWHLSQDFGNLPALNDEFIESNTPVDRTIAVPSEPHFLFDSYFNLRCARPMPLYGVPGLIDHF